MNKANRNGCDYGNWKNAFDEGLNKRFSDGYTEIET
jgi:hypothetical protein